MRDIGQGLYQLDNGAQGRYVDTDKNGRALKYKDTVLNRKKNRVGQTYQRFVLTKGADAGKGYPRRSITKEQAQRAFNRYWNRRMQQVSGNKRKAGAVKSAKKRDLGFGVQGNIRQNTTYLRNPGKYEFPGVDVGTKNYPSGAKLSQKQRDALARGRVLKGPSKASVKRAAQSPEFRRKALALLQDEGEMAPTRAEEASALAEIRQDQILMNDRCLLLQSGEKLSEAELNGISGEVMEIVQKYNISPSVLGRGNSSEAVRKNCAVLRTTLTKAYNDLA